MSAAELPLRETALGLEFDLRAAPGASRSRILGLHGGALKVAVTAAPERGKANAALLAYLAEVLGCARSDLAVLRGQNGRDKRLRCRGLSAAEFRARLAAAM